MKDIKDTILENFKKFNNSKVKDINILKQSGSYRKYYRLSLENTSILAAYNPDSFENDAFVSFANHFASKGLNVPEIYNYYPEEKIYFLEDLGDKTFYDFMNENHDDDLITEKHKKILKHLLKFQTQGIKGLDLSKCYPREEFDKQSIMWDLNYFKHFTLKQAKVNFNEQKIEDDFNKLADFLTKTNTNFFLFRDFKAKNIMLKDNNYYFIDFQGGRKGAIYYDLASILFDSKTTLSQKQILELAKFYFSIISEFIEENEEEFFTLFYHYVLIRLLQTFGTYGFRGLVEKKNHFIDSIPKAIENFKFLLKNKYLTIDLPELKSAMNELVTDSDFTKMFEKFPDVKIRINSFSFIQNGYPADKENNGGGFVYDCRFLPNPGREEKYKSLTGLDHEVIDYLESIPEVEEFIATTVDSIRKAAQNYQKLGYNNIQINFGCTGGRHRSVYSAEKTAELLKKRYKANIEIKHLQKNNW